MLVNGLSSGSLLVVLALPSLLFQEEDEGAKQVNSISRNWGRGWISSAASGVHSETLGECLQSLQIGVLTFQQLREGPCLPGSFRWRSPRAFVKDDAKAISDKRLCPSQRTVSYVGLLVSPRLTSDSTSADPSHGAGTEMLLSTWQGSEKFAEIPVFGRRTASKPQYAVVAPSSWPCALSALRPMKEQPFIATLTVPQHPLALMY